MKRGLKNIIAESDDLYSISIIKPDRHNRSTWQFNITDSRWTYEYFDSSDLQPVYLRRNNNFFMAYKKYINGRTVYFVDPKRALYKTSIRKFINGQIDYIVHSNDISQTKDMPSFKITKNEMCSKHINNFLDLAYEYRNYSAIGTGYTRDIRNLIVMDIDVDCTKEENKYEINNLLIKFAKCNALPDFIILNHESKHIQMQWLIKDLKYKELSKDIIENNISDLNNDPIKNKEVNFLGTDFTEITKNGIDYRRYLLALCDIVKKRKFGDKNYTFWKAKNPMSAMEGFFNLELKMPYMSNGEIKYLEKDEISRLFSTKKERQIYFNEAPDITEIYKKTDILMNNLIKKISKNKVLKVHDAENLNDIKEYHPKSTDTYDSDSDDFGKSRNTFVLKCTRKTTWETAKKYGLRNPKYISKLSYDEFNKFKNEIYKIVLSKFKEKDIEYNSIWPDTTNKSLYTQTEFLRTFNESFNWAIQQIKDKSYSNDDRKKSMESRHYKKDIKLIAVDKIRLKYKNISRNDLLKEVNKSLEKKDIKISMGSLKRYINISKSLTNQDRDLLYDEQKQYIENKKQQIKSIINS